MNKNIKIAKELVKIAKNLMALDEEGDGSGFQFLHDKDNFEQNRLDIAEKQGKKYILHHQEFGFWRIQACKNFGDVKKGDFGGRIASEENLSHDGNCWIYDNAFVSGKAQVYDNAKVAGHAYIYDNAQVYGDAQVYQDAQVYGSAKVYGKA